MNTKSVDASAASKLHKEALVINALDPTPTGLWASDPREDNKTMSEYIDALQAGGVNAVNQTLSFPEENFRQAIASYIRWQRRLASVRERIVVVKRAGDLLQAQRNGKVGVILGFQNAKPIEDDLGLIGVFHRLDIRVIQLTYNRRNYIGDGCGERVDGGLSKFGVAAVQELNRIGMVVDLAHGGTRTALDAVEVSSMPIIISHTGARALCQHFRCIPDELIRAVALRGGCIGIGAFSLLLRDDGVTAGSTLMDYLAHMEHMIEVAGIDHVGIGFDVGFKHSDADTVKLEAAYPEFKLPPLHLLSATELSRLDKAPNLTTALVERGFREEDIRKLLGLNWYRVFAQVWGE